MTDAPINRSYYPCLKDNIYLNQSSLGLIGQPAVQAMHDFLNNVARHGNLKMTDEDEAGFFDSLRQRGAAILNCDTDQLAILSGASECLGQLPLMIRPGPGSNIVLVPTDFPAVTRPWIRYSAENGCSLRFVDDVGTENLTDKLIDSIDGRTAVVAVGSVQFSTGSMVNIPLLRDAATHVNARLVVDVTQAAGILKIDSRAWEADAVVTSGYKWLGGHGGVALAAMSPELIAQSPPLPGWMGTGNPFEFDATHLHFAGNARRFTQSTMSYISMVGLTTALDQLLVLNGNRLEEHSRNLSQGLIDGVSTHGWVPFRGLEDPSASPHIVSLSHSERDVEKTMDALRRSRIVCGIRNGRIRVSLAPYNNNDDIDTLIDMLSSNR